VVPTEGAPGDRWDYLVGAERQGWQGALDVGSFELVVRFFLKGLKILRKLYNLIKPICRNKNLLTVK
jgi:hypothetical protein